LARGVDINLFLQDALWFSDAGELIASGLIPHRDFSWAYGGYEVYLVGTAMKWFGVSIRAVQQAAALHYLIAILLLSIGTARRAPWPIFILLFLLVSAVCLTRYPFEHGPAVNMDVQAISMWYNRIAWSFVIISFATLLTGRNGALPGELVVAGICLYLMALTKLTFGLFLPLALAIAWYRSGLRGLGWTVMGLIIGLGLVWALIGVGPPEFALVLRDAQQNYADYLATDTRFGPFLKLAYMLLTSAAAIAGLAIAAVYLWTRDREWRLPAVLLVMALGFIVGVSTAAFGALTVVPPTLCLAAILLAEHALEKRTAAGFVLAGALAVYGFAFTTPYLLNYAAGIAKGQVRVDQSIFRYPPLAGLVVDRLDNSTIPEFPNHQAAINYIVRRLAVEKSMTWASDHEWQYVYADAVHLARPYRHLRITSLAGGLSHFALASRPTSSFAFIYGIARPGTSNVPPPGYDGILLPRFPTYNRADAFFRPAVETQFQKVGQTALWTLYLRKQSAARSPGVVEP
jgi:hypothetical protein